jgi:DNA polymerase-1
MVKKEKKGEERERLFLLDGTALAFRAHFAMFRSGLTAPDGRPTGATYGFTTTLRRILDEEQPDRIAVAFDPPGPTFRHKQYKEYKATRERAPEDLIAQLDLIRDVVRAHGITIYEAPGWEADDVIGTLAKQAEEAGLEVLIVTGDKDLMQLVGDHVRLYNVFKRGTSEAVIEDADAVREKFGAGPEHVIDVLAIMGDSSDNVPGVKGIGEKGAAKLVSEHGGVDDILAKLDALPPKTREKLEADRDMLMLSRQLVTIDTAVPLDPGLDAAAAAEPDTLRLVELFTELDFRSLAEKVETPEREEAPRDYVTVRTRAELESMIAELREAGSFAVDTETTSLFPLEADIVGASFSAREGRAFYVPFNLDPPVLGDSVGAAPTALLEALAPLLTDPSLQRTGQNYKYDALVFAGSGLHVPPPDFDTMVASYCVAGATRRHNLDALALHYFGIRKIPTSQLIGTGAKQVTMAEVEIDEVAEYACEDADVTWRLRGVLERELEEKQAEQLFRDLEMPLVPVLTAMEERGIRLDVAHIESFAGELEEDMRKAEYRVHELAGRNFNVASTKVLGQVLFEELRIQDDAGVKRPKKTKTGWATDAETLSTKYPGVEIVERVLEYREISKLKGTYVEALPRFVNKDTGRVHCSFSQVTAATGRLASSDPNLQNIPVRTERGRRIREAFVPREPDEHGTWELLAADYSQIELRVMAHLSGDEGLRAAFDEGRDIHAATASKIFDVAEADVDRAMRSQAKVINFGLLYGMGPQRLARETGMTVPEALDFIERYFGSFPRVREWIDGLLESARGTGYVETLLGRRRYLPDIRSGNQRVAALAENAAVNTPVQGSAADIIKRAMIDLDLALASSGLQAQVLLQVHDELVLEAPVAERERTVELVREAMEGAVELDVPLVVDFGWGSNWLEAH